MRCLHERDDSNEVGDFTLLRVVEVGWMGLALGVVEVAPMSLSGGPVVTVADHSRFLLTFLANSRLVRSVVANSDPETEHEPLALQVAGTFALPVRIPERKGTPLIF